MHRIAAATVMVAMGLLVGSAPPAFAQQWSTLTPSDQRVANCHVTRFSDRITFGRMTMQACIARAIEHHTCEKFGRALSFYWDENQYWIDIDGTVSGNGRKASIATLNPAAYRQCRWGGEQARLVVNAQGKVEYAPSQYVTRCGPRISAGRPIGIENVPPAAAEISTDRLVEIGLEYARQGFGTPEYYAAVCMMKAARRGDERAMFYLGNLYGSRELYDIEAKRNWLSLAVVRARQTGNADIERRASKELAFEQPAERAARERRAAALIGSGLLSPNSTASRDIHPHEVRCMMKQGPC